MTDLPPPLPDVATNPAPIPTAPVEPQAVDPRTIVVWRWRLLGNAVVILLLTGVGAVLLGVNYPDLWPLAGAVFLLLLLLQVYYVLRYPGAYYRRLRYWIDEKGIRIQSGVFWRSLSWLPRVRIQHSDVSQGPLQRRHGVATLKLYTAGSQFTKIELDGLEYNTAVALRDQLQKHDTGDAV